MPRKVSLNKAELESISPVSERKGPKNGPDFHGAQRVYPDICIALGEVIGALRFISESYAQLAPMMHNQKELKLYWSVMDGQNLAQKLMAKYGFDLGLEEAKKLEKAFYINQEPIESKTK